MSVKSLGIAFQHITRLIPLSDDDKRKFEVFADEFLVERNNFLLHQGEICRYEYLVLKGCLRSFYTTDDSGEHTTMFAMEGWWTGNLKSFVHATPSEYAIQALERTTVIRIHRSKIDALYSSIPQFERYFRILLQNRLIATQDRVQKHLSSSASERYLQFIGKYPEIERRVPLKFIASYLGITPTYLSRLRKLRIRRY